MKKRRVLVFAVLFCLFCASNALAISTDLPTLFMDYGYMKSELEILPNENDSTSILYMNDDILVNSEMGVITVDSETLQVEHIVFSGVLGQAEERFASVYIALNFDPLKMDEETMKLAQENAADVYDLLKLGQRMELIGYEYSPLKNGGVAIHLTE